MNDFSLEEVLFQIEWIIETLESKENNETLFLAIEFAHQLRDELLQVCSKEPEDE